MKFKDLRDTAQTGDVLIVKGEGIISKIIRSVTGESFSHVAMVIVNSFGQRRIFEFVEGKGFQTMSMPEWFSRRAGQTIFYGMAPAQLDREAARIASGRFKFSESYGYLSLVKVWLSQLIGRKIKTRQKVCSTYVQHCWECGGIKFKETADPGDYVNICESISRVTF